MAKDKNPVEIHVTSKTDTRAIEETTEKIDDTTEATKKLTAAEEDRARRKREYEERMAAKRANGTNVANFPGSDANPMADGSQLGSVNAVTEAVQVQRKSWEELSEVQEDAAVIEQRLADVEEARRIGRARDIEDIKREADETVKAQQAMQTGLALKATAIAGVATAWATLTGEVRKQIDALKEISPEAAKQFAAYEAGLSALENPFRAAILPTIRETEEEMNLLRQAIQNAATAEANYQAAVKARAEEVERAAKNRIEGTLARELQIIEDQNAAYERQLRIIRSFREADAEQAKLSDARAVSAGADSTSINAQASGREAGAQLAALRERADQARFRLDQQGEIVQSLVDALAASAQGPDREEISRRVDEAIRTRDSLRAELETVLQENSAQEIIVNSQLQQSILGASEERQRAAAESANQVVSQIENSGLELGEINKRGLAAIRKVTEDGRVTEQETTQLAEGFQAALAGIRGQLDNLVQIQADINASTSEHTSAIRQLQIDAEKAKQQAETLRQRQ